MLNQTFNLRPLYYLEWWSATCSDGTYQSVRDRAQPHSLRRSRVCPQPLHHAAAGFLYKAEGGVRLHSLH